MNPQQIKIQKTLAALKKLIDGLEPKQKAAMIKHLRALYGHLAGLLPKGQVAGWMPTEQGWMPVSTKPAAAARAKLKPKRK